MNLNEKCFGVAYSGKDIYVASRKTVYVYTLKNSVLRSRITNESFVDTRNVTFNVYCRLQTSAYSNWHCWINWKMEKSIYVGCVLVGVCLDGNGCVLVCGHKGNTGDIFQFSEDGQMIGTLLAKAGDVVWPQAISYDEPRASVVVSQYRVFGDTKNWNCTISNWEIT